MKLGFKVQTFLQRNVVAKKIRTKMPRRLRRGFSMVEMTLVLIVTSLILQTGVEMATAHTKRQITQRSAATMSRVADDIQTYMESNYFTLTAQLASAPGNVIEVDWLSLINGNLVSLDAVPLSPDGGDMRLFFTMRGDAIYSVVMSFDGNGSNFSPRPDPNTKFAGKVQGHAPNDLNGWDFSLSIPEIANLTGEDLTGNIGVVRQVSVDVNVDPYLHRIAIPGRPDLNQMLGDLDMGGFSISNALSVTTQDLQVHDEMVVSGRIDASLITSSGDVSVEEIEADQVVSDEVDVNNATISGDLQAQTAAIHGHTVTNTLVGTQASLDDLSVTDLNGGSVYLSTGNYINIDVGRIDAELIIADQVFIGD